MEAVRLGCLRDAGVCCVGGPNILDKADQFRLQTIDWARYEQYDTIPNVIRIVTLFIKIVTVVASPQIKPQSRTHHRI